MLVLDAEPAGGSGEAQLGGREDADTGEKAQPTAGQRVWALFGRQRAKGKRIKKRKN